MDNIELSDPDLRYLEPLLMLRNVFGKFFDVSAMSGPAFSIPRAGRGAVAADLDNDGFVDIVVSANGQPAAVLRNQGRNNQGGGSKVEDNQVGDKQGGTSQGGASNHWLTVDVIGTLRNRDGIGTRIRLVSESGQEQFSFVRRGGSYLSAGDKRVHFGLGSDEVASEVELRWPSGAVQTLGNVRADQVLTIKEPSVPER